MKLPRPWLVLTALLGGALAVALGIAGWVSSSSRVHVTPLDPRFRILSVKLLHSPEDHFYEGNQIEGRVRDFLGTRLHFKVRPIEDLVPYLSGAMLEVPPWGSYSPRHAAFPATLALRFSLRDPTGSLPPMPAHLSWSSWMPAPPATLELRDPAGVVVGGGAFCYGGTNPYCMLLNLDTDRFRAGNYKVRVLRGGICLAEVEIRDLPRLKQPEPGPLWLTNFFPLATQIK